MAIQIETLPDPVPTRMIELHPDDTTLFAITRAVIQESSAVFLSAAIDEFGQSLDETGGHLTYVAQRVRHRQQDRPAAQRMDTLAVSPQDWGRLAVLSERTGLPESEVAPLALIHRVETLRRAGKKWAQLWGAYVEDVNSTRTIRSGLEI